MPWTPTFLLAAVVIAAAVVAVARRVDVRLALFLAALGLGAIAGDIGPVLRTFLQTLSSEQFVVPICTAMGFAQVLRQSECDRHLIHLLTRPLRHVRPLLIPGTVVVGFIVNISVISQASTAVALGTVIVPLLRSARLTPTTVGASLALGASLGGELLNPGAPEINTIASRSGAPAGECVERILPLLLVQLGVAIAVFWPLCHRAEARAELRTKTLDPAAENEIAGFRIRPWKAIVPIIPLGLLMIVGPPFNLVHVPQDWLVDRDKVAAFAAKLPEPSRGQLDQLLGDRERLSYGSRLIGVSMLFGTAIAALAAPGSAGASARVFFEGAGLALTRIVSVIVIASCFGTGIKQLKLDEPIRALIEGNPGMVWPLAGGLTLLFAALCGSGMAATQSLYAIFVADGMGTELMLRVGAVVAISAAAGRTMSPVAAVVLTCASLTNSEPLAIARRVIVPLLAATLVMVTMAWWRGG
jgi:DcuC family C4-dicarboxylate transporter